MTGASLGFLFCYNLSQADSTLHCVLNEIGQAVAVICRMFTQPRLLGPLSFSLDPISREEEERTLGMRNPNPEMPYWIQHLGFPVSLKLSSQFAQNQLKLKNS